VDHMTSREAAEDHSGGIWNSALHQQSVAPSYHPARKSASFLML
jgi:hypothetical protein